MRAYSLALAIFSVFATFLYVYGASSQDQTIGDINCTADCSGHAAGYAWAQAHDVDDESDCPSGDSQSFHDGCVAYTRGSRFSTDDGNQARMGVPRNPLDDENDDDDDDR